ncbi:hypothetical protein FB567DRAFT_124068 [Paraphoma chrysanthemicola]|uniref:Lytic polysaccharide monooxygenase n=1 Tax=Paraphoma chrysanthemicola TaxID=798071 RepID=A0A8K0VVT1_9PLEO|nr:hypothetical protein FB567DRAFT_124068 [Paraphoma chrysanthemicola]
MFSNALALLALAASASAHMTILNPVPFGQATLNSSPLGPGDFPCKQRSGVYDITQMNQWNAGTTQVVSFKGSAVHGGGSCQFSITTDPEPTDKSQWKVIQSVVGGCPSNVTGNLPSGSHDDLTAATFPVTMPSDIPDGRYTFAWTWINKVGNREFYMNCAPVQVGSGSGKASTASAASALGALPDMFVANLPATECSTKENEDFVYPNPGKNLVEGNGAALGDTLTGSGCTKQNAMGAGAGSIGSPSEGTPATPSQGTPVQSSKAPSQPQASGKPAASSAPSYNTPTQSKVPTNPGGVFAPGASSAPASGPTAVPSAPAAVPTTPAVAKPAPSAGPGDNNTTPVNGECTPCNNDGAVVCIGSNQFGLCNRGCAVAQDLAAGMACSAGVVVAATKRHVHFPRAHLHRRLSAARFL